MNKLILLTIFSIFCITLNAQQKQTKGEKPPTRKEIEEMIKEMQEALDDPEMQEMMKEAGKNMPDFDALQKAAKMAGQNSAGTQTDPPTEITAAAKASALKLRLNNANLQSYLDDLHANVDKMLSRGKSDSLNKVVAQFKDPEMIAELGAALYYKDGPTEAIWFLTRAASMDKSDHSTLNNMAAILIMTGAEHVALPVLRYLEADHPENTTVLNNLGQALFGLGEIKESKKKLEECLAIYAMHPQANITMCLIQESEGKDGTENIEKSLEGAFTEEAWEMARQRNIKFDHRKFKPETRPDSYEYFNPLKYLPPAQNSNVYESAKREAEWKAWNTEISRVTKILTLEGASYGEKYADDLSKGKIVPFIPPLALKAQFMVEMYTHAFAQAVDEAVQYHENQYQEAVRQISEDFSREWKAFEERYKDRFGEGKENPFDQYCADKDRLNNRYLERLSALNDQFNEYYAQNVRLLAAEVMNWLPMYPLNQNANKVEYYKFAAWAINPLIVSTPFTPQCKADKDQEASWPELEVPKFECPINFRFKFKIMKISANCEVFGVELTPVPYLVINYDRNFVRKTSTLALGAGASTDGIPVIDQLGGGAGAKIQGFIEWGSNGVSDIGVSAEAGVDAIGVTDKDVKVVAKIGISSGPQFTPVYPGSTTGSQPAGNSTVSSGLRNYVYQGN